MNTPQRRAAGFALVLFAGCVGGCGGLIGANWYRLSKHGPDVRAFPMPHHLSKYEGGISLRFAMVHDVIHERFPRHGEAYYRERNRLAQKTLAAQKGKHDDAYFGLCDDLGAGLDFLKQDDEAVRVLRNKLRAQLELGYKDRQLYTSYANLGTFLIHGNARAALGGDGAAKERMREGLSFLRKSIEVNPEAHFGREVWQAVAVEYLFAVIANPNLLLQYDMVGDDLNKAVDPRDADCIMDNGLYGNEANHDVEAVLQGKRLGSPWPTSIREYHITKVGAETGWNKAVPGANQKPVPFDEPTLGIIGMWRLGGGASPTFALALGEIMLRVGQRYIAWCAFERAASLAEHAWPDVAIQQQFAEHCKNRQKDIEQQLPAKEAAELRPRFHAELAYGRRFQLEYQDYEAERIGSGTALNDEHFYDAFYATHPPIASPVGREDKFVAAPGSFEPHFNWPIAAFAAGLGACLAAWIVRLWNGASTGRG